MGRAAYAGHHLAPAPDRLGNSRQAIVFELTLEDSEGPSVVPVAVSPATTPREESAMWRQPLAQLRQSAIESAPAGSAPELRKRVAYKRSAAVRIYALRKADGRCEASAVRSVQHGQGSPVPRSLITSVECQTADQTIPAGWLRSVRTVTRASTVATTVLRTTRRLQIASARWRRPMWRTSRRSAALGEI